MGVDKACEEVFQAWQAEVAVVVLDALPADVQPTAFTAALLNFWGVGDARLHSGAVILLLMRQRRLEMRVGYGAARVLTPEVLKSIQDEQMVPHLRAGKPGDALAAGARGMLAALEAAGPSQWRRQRSVDDCKPETNRHGFGGGQTPMDEFTKK